MLLDLLALVLSVSAVLSACSSGDTSPMETKSGLSDRGVWEATLSLNLD